MTNVFLFKIQAADIDLCCFNQETRAKKRLFTFFGIVPCQELFGIMSKFSWFQLIWFDFVLIQVKKEMFYLVIVYSWLGFIFLVANTKVQNHLL